MEIRQLDNESHAPIACGHCPTLRPHRATHSTITRHPDNTRRVDYLCPQATARELGLPLWKHLPIDVLTEAELGPLMSAVSAELAELDRRNAAGTRRAATKSAAAAEHALNVERFTEAELAELGLGNAAGMRGASPVERLAASLHSVAAGLADPTPATIAKLIAEAINSTANTTAGAVSE
jgi:hypothetical protein